MRAVSRRLPAAFPKTGGRQVSAVEIHAQQILRQQAYHNWRREVTRMRTAAPGRETG